MPLSSNTNTAISINPRIIEVESLDFESSPLIYPSTQAQIKITGKTLTTFEHKEMMVLTAIIIGYGSANADNERIINDVRKRAHCFFGFPEPSFNNHRIKIFINKHAKADDLCDPSLLPNNILKRNKQSKTQKILLLKQLGKFLNDR